jgi:multiple sugar transport system ATP-binding protein
MAELTLDHITKVYRGGVVAVSEAALRIPHGALCVLVGPSGCGKTTVLRLIAGLEELTDGAIWIGENDVTQRAPRDRNVAMVFQNYALYPHMTALENMAFGLRTRRMKKDEIRRRVASAAELLGLMPVLHQRPKRLSGGQRQRVALGRAIVQEADVWLMDEPLSNLDAKLRDQMRNEIARIQRRLEITTLYVTHDQTEALTLGDVVAVMDEGVIRQVGTPKHVYDHPRDLFVAAFVGSPPMNLAEATLEPDDGGSARARFGRHELVLEGSASALNGSSRRQVVVGIRPEHIGSRPPGAGAAMDVVVDRREAVGSETYVRFAVDAPLLLEDDPRRSSLEPHGADGVWSAERENTFVARIDHELVASEGERVRLGVDTSRVHLFDPVSGLALR